MYPQRRRRITPKRIALCVLAWSVLIITILILIALLTFLVMGIKKRLFPDNAETEMNNKQEINLVRNVTESDYTEQELFHGNGIQQSGRTRTDGIMVLVNKDVALSQEYDVSLTSLKNGQQVASVIYEDLKDMLFDGEAEERISFLVASGYRTKEEQEQLLQGEILKNMKMGMNYETAYQDALCTVAPPGHSEHETGLAVDIVAVSNQRLDDTQQYTRENQWLQEHCHEYGFILRYPEGKEAVTGFSYESWHFRYVGKDVAREITERGITLEEYLVSE